MPRWAFEKFPQADRTLTTQMKSVGEAMAIGRTFKESFLKAFRSLELGKSGLLFGQHRAGGPYEHEDDTALQQALGIPTDRRMWAVFRALEQGLEHRRNPPAHAHRSLVPDAVRRDRGDGPRRAGPSARATCPTTCCSTLKRAGFGDADLAVLLGTDEDSVRERRREAGIVAAYKRIDTCAAEFESFTPYMYGTFEQECEATPNARRKVVILGSGPNRIGQGIEFDYCCCHAAFALREEGYETVMVNCNPETVSTDYDTVDRLYFEPLTFENVHADHRAREIRRRRRRVRGAVRRPDAAQARAGAAGGRRSDPRHVAGLHRSGGGPEAVLEAAVGSRAFRRRPSGTATSQDEARAVATEIGFPVVVRPSYVLGGRAMAIVYDMAALDRYMRHAVNASPEHPILIDKFLEDATEIDVDCLADAGGAVVIGGIMEHIEQAGIHSGDSSCVVPTVQAQRPARRHDSRLHRAASRAR